jgi:hypothetical protein
MGLLPQAKASIFNPPRNLSLRRFSSIMLLHRTRTVSIQELAQAWKEPPLSKDLYRHTLSLDTVGTSNPPRDGCQPSERAPSRVNNRYLKVIILSIIHIVSFAQAFPYYAPELGINFPHIRAKSLTVLNPFRRVDEHIMDDADLAGPLLFFLCFGTFLLFVSV